MAKLQDQSVNIALTKGIDTKIDAKQAQLGKLLVGNNVTYEKIGKIKKRKGFEALPKTIIGGTSNILSGQALATFKEELLAFDEDEMFSYVSGNNKWKSKGSVTSIYSTSRPVSNGTGKEYDYDSAYNSVGLQAFFYTRVTSTGTALFYTILDYETGQTVIAPTSVTTTGQSPRVVAFGTSFYFFYYDTSTTRLKAAILTTSNPSATLSFQFITNDDSTADGISTGTPAYEVAVIETRALGEQLYLMFNSRLPTRGIRLRRYRLGSFTASAQTTIAGDNMRSGSIFYEQFYDGPCFVYAKNLGTSKGSLDNAIFYRVDAAVLADSNEIESTLAFGGTSIDARPYHVTGVSLSQTEFDLRIYFDYIPASGTRAIQSFVVNDTSAFGAITAFGMANFSPFNDFDDQAGTSLNWSKNQCSIAGEAFQYNGVPYLLVEAGPQSTYFILNDEAKVVAKFYTGVAGGLNSLSTTEPWCPAVDIVNETTFVFPVAQVSEFGTVGGETLTGISSIKIDFFEQERSYSRTEIGDNLHIGGGIMSTYDGVSVVEQGFNWYPEISYFVAQNTSSGYSYQYKAVYEWVDAAGNIHRSSPSDAYAITSGAPISPANTVEGIIRSLTLTDKLEANGRSPVMVVIYRTENNGEIFYRLPTNDSNINTDTQVNTSPDADETTDEYLTGYEQLYTTAEVENDQSPPVGAMVVHRNRLFVKDSTNPLQVWYSKLVSPGVPVEFSNAQILNIDPSGGEVMALASLDDKLIIFKENAIRYVVGQGPDRDGTNNDYGDSIFITADVGCSNPRSVTLTSKGIIFKSRKGIYMLDRGLAVSYIGAPVEDYNDKMITSAVLNPDKNHIRLTLDNSTTLVYDYFVGNWSVFTNIAAVDSTLWKNDHAYIRSSGQVMVENDSLFKDNGTPISMKFETTWLNFGGIQGFQRLWSFYILGDWKSDHRLKVKIYYDFNNNTPEEIIVSPTELSLYGTGTYGSEAVYGGTFTPYQYQVKPSRQKCTSIKISVEDIAAVDGTFEESCEISNIRFDYGIIGKGNRLADSQVFGGS